MNAAPTIVVQHAELGVCHEVPVKDLERASPALLLSYLQRQGALPQERADRPYMVIADGKRLLPNESLARQGIGDHAVLTVLTRGLGASDDGLELATPERRALDFQTMTLTFARSDKVRFRAFRSVAAMTEEEETTTPEEARVYTVDLQVRSPFAPDEYHDRWRVRLDASVARYPLNEPIAHFLHAPKPWNPHVREVDGYVCAGTLWHPSKLLAFFVIDVMRVLCFDFGIDPSEQGGHFQPAAVAWWKFRHGGRPIGGAGYPTVRTPDLRRAFASHDPSDVFGDQ